MKSNKSILAIVILLTIFVLLGWFFWNILIYMLIALALSFLGKPLMRLMSHIHIKGKPFPTTLAATITLCIILGVILCVCFFLIPVIVREIYAVINIDPTALGHEFEAWLNRLDPTLRKLGLISSDQHFSTFVSEEISEIFQKIDMSDIVSNTFKAASALLVGLFSVLFMTFFSLKDHGIFFRMIGEWIPTKYRENFSNILNATGKQLSSYFIGVFVDMLIVGLLEFLICLLLRVPNPFLIGSIGGLLNIIPFVGPIIACLAGIVISLTSLIPSSPDTVLLMHTLIKVIIAFCATKAIDDFILQPTIYGKRTQTHPLEIFIVILMAGSIGGVFAMIFAVPAYTLLRIVVKEFFGVYFTSSSDEVPIKPTEGK